MNESGSREGGSSISDSVPVPGGPVPEHRRTEIKSALEKLRGHIMASVDIRDQWRLLQIVDVIQERVMKADFDLAAIQTEIQNAKGTTRRHLRQRPGQMAELLSCLDGLEQGIVDFFNLMFKNQ